MTRCPCQGCEDRTITCHCDGFCDKWAEWKAENIATKQWLRTFDPIYSERAKAREARRIRKKARGWEKKVRGGRE